MNILPLVCGLLFILVLGSTTLMQGRLSTYLEEKSYSGLMQAARLAQTKIARKLYASAGKAPAKDTKKTSKKELHKTEYRSRRAEVIGRDSSRLNVAKLLDKDGSELHKHLYETTASLLRILYGEAPFFKQAQQAIPEVEYRLVDAMIAKGGKTLPDLRPETPVLADLFYKMMRGTHGQGYPRLSDYLALDKGKKAVSFCFASAPLLEAFLGKALAHEILAKEQKKWEKDHIHRTVTQKELREMLMHHPTQQFEFPKLSELLNFSNRSGKSTSAIGTDPATGIDVKYILD